MQQDLLDVEILGRQVLLHAYQTFFWLAVIAALAVSVLLSRQVGLPLRRVAVVLAAAAVSVPVGARLLNVATKPATYAEQPDLVVTTDLVGFSLMGGVLLAVAVGIVVSRALGLSAWRLADVIAPGLFIGVAVMRVGCYLNGCCFGHESELPWAVSFPYGSPAAEYFLANPGEEGLSLFSFASAPTVHPTQLYELGGALLCALLALVLLGQRLPAGTAFLASAMAFAVVRLGNDLLRVQSTTDEWPRLTYPVLYAVLIVVMAALLGRILARQRQGEGRPSPTLQA